MRHAATAADRPLSAARELFGWAFASGRIGSGLSEPNTPPGGWLGRFDRPDGWTWIALVPDQVRSWLKQKGHEPDAIFRQWADRGVLLTTSGHSTTPTRLPGQSVSARMLRFDRAKLEEHGIVTRTDAD